MENDRIMAVRRTARLHLGMEAVETLRQIEEFADNPSAMDYFYNFFRKAFTEEADLTQKKRPVATMCVQVPDELIYACGASPARFCSGAYAYDRIGADHMPAKSCPLIRATAGMLSLHQGEVRDTPLPLVFPSTCDQKKKMAEYALDLGYKVIQLEMPSSKESESARFYWQESIKQFTLDLQKITGRRITRKSLKQAIARKTEACRLFRRLYELRLSASPVILGKDMFLVSNCFFLDNIDSWTNAATALLSELEQRADAGFTACSRNAPRILLTGSPPIFPNIKVPMLVEQSGGVIVADEVCSSSRLLYDAVSYDEENLDDMIPAIADRYLKPCTCPCLSPNFDRIRKVVAMVKEYKVDGVVYQSFSGCLPYEMEQRQLAQNLERVNTPMLYVETDYSPEDRGQLSTRIEAFVESISMRRRKQRGAITGPCRK